MRFYNKQLSVLISKQMENDLLTVKEEKGYLNLSETVREACRVYLDAYKLNKMKNKKADER